MPGILRCHSEEEMQEEEDLSISQESPTSCVTVTHDSESGIEDVGETDTVGEEPCFECGTSVDDYSRRTVEEVDFRGGRRRSDIKMCANAEDPIYVTHCDCPSEIDMGSLSAPENRVVGSRFSSRLNHDSGFNICHSDADCRLQCPAHRNVDNDHVLKDISQNEQNSDGKGPIGSSSNAEHEKKSSSKSSPRKSPPKSSPIHTTPPYLSSYVDSAKADKENDIPTDQSDAVDSDVERKRVGVNSSEIIVCPDVSSHHIGREAINSVYHLPIETLFTLLFTNSKFMLDLQTSRKTYDVISSPWQSNPETNQKIRQVTYTMTLPTNSFGPKVSHVTETQVLSAFSEPGSIYTVDSEACNAGIPYADAFYISNHWCLTSESVNETRLSVWAQVKYKKSIFGFMKNVIDKSVFAGIESHMNELDASLQLEVETTQKRTKRRRRRAGSKSEGPELFSHTAADNTKGSSFEAHKTATQMHNMRKMTMTPASVNRLEASYSWKKVAYLLIPVLILLSLNAFLYYRLADLDDRVFRRQDYGRSYSLHSLGLNIGTGVGGDISLETWIHILQEQEALHLEEVQRWKNAVVEAADYLRKAEESLRSLQTSIPQQQASKVHSLIQHLHRLQSMKEAAIPADLKDSLVKSNINIQELPSDSSLNEKETC